MSIYKGVLGGIFKLPDIEDLKNVFKKINYVPMDKGLIEPTKTNFPIRSGYEAFSKLGSVALGGIKEVGYKLGFLKRKFEGKEIPSAPGEKSLPRTYRNWYPGKEKEIGEAERILEETKAKAALFARRQLKG